MSGQISYSAIFSQLLHQAFWLSHTSQQFGLFNMQSELNTHVTGDQPKSHEMATQVKGKH